ncbi:hypothetical protein KFE25_007489 [Diacronema lutheri]|uniref:Enkurin domain-containing protein n=2 Tax=Diacronema lutheri TaxID=2081491 RepID=A0A8J5XHF8_DIALT|nr:hypothetical protein KFE25_007489 [Diacronema lutheri]
MSGDLDALIAAQNAAVLGGEDPAARASPAPAMSGGAPPGAQLAYPGAPAHASSGGGVHTSVRVHKDGSAINSSQMEAALNPARNDRDAMRRAGLHPHNHHRDNVSKIREKQQEVAAKKAFESQAAQRTDDQRRRARELAAATAQRASTAGAVASDASRAAKQPASQQTVGRHESYGKVPTYLAERNRAKEAEETLAREEAAKRASCPPGTRLVTEDERTAVLATIAAREAELRKELNALPFVTKTLSTANRKKALEDRLEEIEGARAQYSKPRVYVALDV